MSQRKIKIQFPIHIMHISHFGILTLNSDFFFFFSNVLRGLATIEADVSSHAEAVLHGRLSKLTQDKLNLEQQRQQKSTKQVQFFCINDDIIALDLNEK